MGGRMRTARNKIFFWALLVMLLLIGGCAGYVWLTLNWSFSDGDRAGYIQKFSKKGWICKTWEGELLMTTAPGVVPEKFFFTVRDEAVAQKINSLMGKKIGIHYEQHKGVPTSCFGESQYFVTDVRILE